LNAREWLPDTAFVDSHHLLQAGAEQFTTRFGRECVLPLVDRLTSTSAQALALTTHENAMESSNR
jgi:hypothetical protein